MANSQLKIFLYAGALFALGVVYGLFFKTALGGGSLIYPIIAGCFYVAALLLPAIFVKGKTMLVRIIAAAFLGLAVISAKAISVNYLIALAASFVFLLIAGVRAMGASGVSFKIDISRFARVFVPTCVTALAILAAFVYTASFIGKDFTLPKESFRSLIAPLGAAKTFIPGFSLDMTVPALIRAILDANPPAELRDIPRDVKEQFLRESEDQFLKTASDALGVPVSRGDSVFDALYRAANAQLVQIPEDLKTPALLLFGFLVFLTIKGFGAIFYYPIVFLSKLIYKLLLKTRFLNIVEEDVKREVVSL